MLRCELRIAMQIIVMYSPDWASEFLVDALVPATRIGTTALLAYWLWQEARVGHPSLSACTG